MRRRSPDRGRRPRPAGDADAHAAGAWPWSWSRRTDVIFAVDSIPAIFAITADPFLVFTSNVFAILGLRSLYFALAGMIDKFRYLKLVAGPGAGGGGRQDAGRRLAQGSDRGELQLLPVGSDRAASGRRRCRVDDSPLSFPRQHYRANAERIWGLTARRGPRPVKLRLIGAMPTLRGHAGTSIRFACPRGWPDVGMVPNIHVERERTARSPRLPEPGACDRTLRVRRRPANQGTFLRGELAAGAVESQATAVAPPAVGQNRCGARQVPPGHTPRSGKTPDLLTKTCPARSSPGDPCGTYGLLPWRSSSTATICCTVPGSPGGGSASASWPARVWGCCTSWPSRSNRRNSRKPRWSSMPGARPPGLPRTFEYRGITVQFAPRNRIADELIADLILAERAPRQLTVVSSDHQVQRVARRRQCAGRGQRRLARRDRPPSPVAPRSGPNCPPSLRSPSCRTRSASGWNSSAARRWWSRSSRKTCPRVPLPRVPPPRMLLPRRTAHRRTNGRRPPERGVDRTRPMTRAPCRWKTPFRPAMPKNSSSRIQPILARNRSVLDCQVGCQTQHRAGSPGMGSGCPVPSRGFPDPIVGFDRVAPAIPGERLSLGRSNSGVRDSSRARVVLIAGPRGWPPAGFLAAAQPSSGFGRTSHGRIGGPMK